MGGLLGLVLAVAAYAPRSRRSSYTPAEQAAPWLSFAAGLALSFAGLALIAWLVCRAILWRDPVNTPE